MGNTPAEKIARILRTDKDTILGIEKVLTEASGHDDVLSRMVEENNRIISEKKKELKLDSFSAEDIYSALLARIEEDDAKISNALDNPVCDTAVGCKALLDVAGGASAVGTGFFLKTEKAKELFIKTPPLNIIKALGYKSAEELVKKEDIFEIFSALRFVEEGDWLNNVFFKQYEKLTPEDFEEREIRTIVLSEKWKEVAEKFLKKKYHNISHLKELGVIFVLPAVLGLKGETLRTLGLVLHYYHEIDFYSNLFKKASRSKDFSTKLVGFLRGDVIDMRLPCEEIGKKWMIVQRYLAKDDEHDWRLFEPHVNPEAIHWKKAEDDISKLGGFVDSIDLSFWSNLDWVGDYYLTKTGIEVLVSFNLVDTVMSLVKKKDMIKYLYHHQEAIWNKLFYEFFGEQKMEQMIIDNFEKGFIEL